MEFYNKEFCIEIWGDYACFTRPEMKVERVSYDVITPSAARAIFEAIFWKPAIQWKIKKIEVLNPIRWVSVRRNEVGKLMSNRSKHIFIEENRQQRAGLLLRDVAYRIYAEIDFTPLRKRNRVETPEELKGQKENEILKKTENPGKYNAIFERRVKKGQCFNQPYLGCREFSCNFKLVEFPEGERIKPINETRDLGFMLYDMDFSEEKDPKPMFFRAQLKKGVIEVPPMESEEVRR
ncbi:MAG: type I-C CRISPR-associated protein Cas5c [Bacteroidia bacterium]|jgi:CRISPR-associated protein Cas5d|nr:type I-C CRISPR-associated protein Cas5c [Bacteroidia bacterium]